MHACRGLKDLLVRRGELASDPRIHLRGVASTRAGSEDARAADRAAPAEVGTSQKPKELVMLFTCGQCNTRAAKAFSKDSYERGVVIVECPGCSSKHLIADHMGWFGSKGERDGSVVVREWVSRRARLCLTSCSLGGEFGRQWRFAAVGCERNTFPLILSKSRNCGGFCQGKRQRCHAQAGRWDASINA